MATILHITTRTEWDAACAAGSYRPAALEDEGFIHCSTPAQVVGSADRYFHGRTDLLLLCIDESRVPDVRYEAPSRIGDTADPRAGERFPHIHGALAVDAVVRVVPFPCRDDGSFALPVVAGG